MIHQVEVIYLNSKGQYERRKSVDYDDQNKAYEMYGLTVKKMTTESVSSVVILRQQDGQEWRLIKSARI